MNRILFPKLLESRLVKYHNGDREQAFLNRETIPGFDDLENQHLDRAEANPLINEIRIRDPAVGAGYFLVSVLNELIAVKSDVGILHDETGKQIRNYTVSILKDELVG